ncbi:hypothetical protein BSL78_25132, partial [Apostichopus japonicus]
MSVSEQSDDTICLEDFALSIMQHLPSLPLEMVDKVVEQLLAAGVESVCDLKLITDEDLSSVLKPIQRRKLLIAWANKAEKLLGSASSQSSEPDSVASSPGCSWVPSSAGSSPAVVIADWAESFKVDWDKMPKSLTKSLQKKQRPTPKDRPKKKKEVQNIIADVESAKKESGDHSPDVPGLILLLCNHLGDKWDDLFYLAKETSTVQNITKDLKSTFPCIIIQ